VTPLQEPGITERHLFYEDYVVYVSPSESVYRKRYVLADDIDTRRLWLLEEGHCMRSQIMRLCELKKAGAPMSNFQYEAGSVETLKRMVETRHGITIIPELALEELTPRQAKVVKQRLLDALHAEILRSLPRTMLTPQGKDVLKLAPADR
jgi:LysR family hydrogen peroxide-inducible transcriptional activator